MVVKTNIKLEDEFNLGVYLLALKTKYAEIGTYEDQAKLIKIEFGVEVNPRDLWLLNEPNLEQEIEEKQLLWENLK
jgi:hypothetical protein